MLRLVWSFILATTPFFIQAVRLFYFLISHVFTAAVNLILIRKFSFALTTWFTVWHKRFGLWPISAFDLPSSLSFNMSSFWLKLRDMGLFPSPEHLEATVGLLAGLISIYCCVSGNREVWGRERDGMGSHGSVRTHGS